MNPGAEEIGWDGVDNDCDGEALDLPWVGVSSWNTCVVHADGTLECKGYSGFGLNSEPSGNRWRQVSMGQNTACALDDHGRVECWGQCAAVDVCNPPSIAFETITVGTGHACGLTSTGDAVCWGTFLSGEDQIGSGPWAKVSAGYITTCAIDLAGSMTCAGHDGDWTMTRPPSVSGRWVDVSVGVFVACGVLDTGVAYCWGDESYGFSHDFPGNWSAVSIGDSTPCFVSMSGTASCGSSTLTSYGPGFSTMEPHYEHQCGIRGGTDIVCFPDHCTYGQCDW